MYYTVTQYYTVCNLTTCVTGLPSNIHLLTHSLVSSDNDDVGKDDDDDEKEEYNQV